MTTPTPKRAIAPYAQACALVNADGSIDRAKGIKSAKRGATAGRFCIELEDTRLDVSELTPVATLTVDGYPGFIYIAKGPTGECGNNKNTITVITTDENRGGVYKPFFIVVP